MSESERMGFSIRTPIGHVRCVSYGCRTGIGVGCVSDTQTQQGTGVSVLHSDQPLGLSSFRIIEFNSKITDHTTKKNEKRVYKLHIKMDRKKNQSKELLPCFDIM